MLISQVKLPTIYAFGINNLEKRWKRVIILLLNWSQLTKQRLSGEGESWSYKNAGSESPLNSDRFTSSPMWLYKYPCELKNSEVIQAEERFLNSRGSRLFYFCFSLRVSLYTVKFTQSRSWRPRSARAISQQYPVTSHPCLSTTDPRTPSREPWPHAKSKNKNAYFYKEWEGS